MKTNWIFLRGWGRDSRHWGEFINLFKEQFSEHCVYLLDVPGTGRCSSEYSPASVANIVDILAARWQEKHPEESTRIVALSFGAMLAVDWATRYPEMIDSVVLMNTSGRNLSPFYRRLRYQIYPDLLLLLASSIMRRERKIIELTSNLYPSRKELTSIWTNYARQNRIGPWNLFRQLWAASRFTLPEQVPRQPVLLLSSLQDRLVHPDCSKRIAQQWQIEVQRHPVSGHDMTLDVPLWVIDQIKAWEKKIKR